MLSRQGINSFERIFQEGVIPASKADLWLLERLEGVWHEIRLGQFPQNIVTYVGISSWDQPWVVLIIVDIISTYEESGCAEL